MNWNRNGAAMLYYSNLAFHLLITIPAVLVYYRFEAFTFSSVFALAGMGMSLLSVLIPSAIAAGLLVLNIPTRLVMTLLGILLPAAAFIIWNHGVYSAKRFYSEVLEGI